MGSVIYRCTGKDCGDSERPIVILAQGVTYHYDGDDKEQAYEDAWEAESKR